MKKSILGLALATALIGLAGCVVTDAPAGAYQVGSAYHVTLGRHWSDVSSMFGVRQSGVHVLSVDGPLLNRLYLSEGLAPGAALVSSQVKEKPTPTFKANLTASELMEFVSDSVSALGYLKVETTSPRPGKFADADGVRFDLTGRTLEGLDISGTALAAVKGGKLYVILYLAPTEHFFADGLPEVEQIMKTATVPG